ncbi:gametocyte-specific factor 1 isoform X1 [Cyprinodon tularosa]|uniref:gametocyte-specific factor 1 isoform X1 n=2 Tax=Cyprinodon tularosa TaxID=77115 RepID=UPI0018E27200|nr:gametocyte-specific factor 1 isoform X1 [Cyprinodon tularosa]
MLLQSASSMANLPKMRSSTGPVQLAENDDNLDPDRLLQCPFDTNHQIRSCRFPYHLIKCRKNHPEIAKKLKTCPYNARHLVPKHELDHHIETCMNKISVDTEDGENEHGWHVPVNTWTNLNSTEDWDKEEDPSPTPFVFGETSKLKQIGANNLGPNFRAPTTLPWSGSNQ